MPAYTVNQLQSQLSQYVEPDGLFTAALAQVLPRIYSMGLWRDLVYDESFDASAGYISLPLEAESIIACTVNKNPRPVRSMWHDVRIVGTQAAVSPYFGIIDDGFHPVILDMKEVQDVETDDDVTTITSLKALVSGSSSGYSSSSFTGDINILVRGSTGNTEILTAASSTGILVFNALTLNFKEIISISYANVLEAIDLVDAAFPTKVIVTIPAGTGVIRYRRFRTSEKSTESVVHLLLKRACPNNFLEDTIVHLGNINAIKHGLLARIAEDNADIQRAEYHWTVCRKMLDEELDAFRGAAKPAPMLDLYGAGHSGPINLY